jgi:hypothetical protein
VLLHLYSICKALDSILSTTKKKGGRKRKEREGEQEREEEEGGGGEKEKKGERKPGVVLYACNPSTQEAETGRS